MIRNIILALLLFCITIATQAQPKYNKTDSKGLKIGEWKQYYSNGKIRYTGQFKNDIAVDTFKYYSENGVLETIIVHLGKGVSTARMFNDQGKIIAIGSFHNKKKDGLWQYYNNDGLLVTEESFKDSLKDGAWKIYYLDGKISSESYWKNGLLNGSWKEYFENGSLKMSSTYSNNKADGDYSSYYIDGKPMIKGKYSKGKLIGKWTYYLQNGNISKVEVYQNGNLKLTEYYQNGVKVKSEK